MVAENNHPRRSKKSTEITIIIKRWYDDAPLYEAKIPADTESGMQMRVALEQAVCAKADLGGADLRSANLRSADLGGANLRSANLGSANLRSADLGSANLGGADLGGADLRSANLRSADLRSADLGGANLTDTKNAEMAIAMTRILPEGSLIGWKKLQGGVIVKLRIPEEAKRSHAFGRKCRAEFADILEIIGAEVGYSQHDSSFKYVVGARVAPKQGFDLNWTEECAPGIHFFLTKLEAEAY